MGFCSKQRVWEIDRETLQILTFPTPVVRAFMR